MTVHTIPFLSVDQFELKAYGLGEPQGVSPVTWFLIVQSTETLSRPLAIFALQWALSGLTSALYIAALSNDSLYNNFFLEVQ